MRYWSRSLAGVVLVAVSIALASVFLYDLVRTGSCASGGPYVSARPCPAGTGWRIAGLMATIFPLPAAGLAILSTRTPGRKLAGALAVGPLWFVLLFTCMGAGALVAGVGPAATDEGGSRTASYIVAGTFLLIGGPALLAMLRGAARSRAPSAPGLAGLPGFATTPRAPAPPRAPSPSSSDRVAARLKELDGLRAAGLITRDEHQAKRAEILADL